MEDVRRGRARSRRLLTALAALLPVVLVACTTAAPAPSSQGVPSRWDDFRRPNAPLEQSNGGTLPSGQPWRTTFAADPAVARAALRIVDGSLRFDTAGAAYAYTTAPAAPEAVGVDVAFLPGSGPDDRNAMGILVSASPGPDVVGPTGIGTNSVHATFGTRSWAVALGTGTGLDLVANGTYDLPPDGTTVRQILLRRTAADALLLTTPDGGTQEISDPRIAGLWGGTALIEHYQPAFATDPRPIVTGYRVLP